MAPALLGLLPSLLPMLGEVLDRVIPDKAEAAKARLEMEGKLLEAATAQATQQTDINKIEAAHSSLFVSGWRPFIGWVCGAGLAWAFVVAPFASWLLVALEIKQTPPQLQIDYLLEMVVALLGLGGLRTFEKLKGVARQ
jgi:hypothetical protein